MIEQLAGRYKVKNPMLRRLHAEVREIAEGFDRIRYRHVPREHNQEADRLANRGVDEWLEGGGATRSTSDSRSERETPLFRQDPASS